MKMTWFGCVCIIVGSGSIVFTSLNIFEMTEITEAHFFGEYLLGLFMSVFVVVFGHLVINGFLED